MTALKMPIQSRLKFWTRPPRDMKNDHYLLPDDGLRSDGIEEEIIFGQDTWENQAKLDFSPISKSISFDRKSPSPVGSEKEHIVQKTRKNLRSDGLDSSNLHLLRNSVIENELIAQKARKKLKNNGLDTSSLDLLIEKELAGQMIRENLKPDGIDPSTFDHLHNVVIEKEPVVQKARKKLKYNGLDSSNLDLLIKEEHVAQMIRENSKPDGIDSSKLDLLRNTVVEKESIAQKTRKNLKPRYSSNLEHPRNVVVEEEPIAENPRNNFKSDELGSSNLDLTRNIIVEKEPIAEKTRNNFKSGGFDSNLDLSRSPEEDRPGLPVTHLQLKVSLKTTSLQVHPVIAAPLCKTVNSSSLENGTSSDPKNPTGTNRFNEYSDYIRRTAKGCRLSRRGRRWRKKEASPADGETSTRSKMKLHLPQIRNVGRRGDSKVPVNVDATFDDNDDMNRLAKTTIPMQRNAGTPAFHDNAGSASTKMSVESTANAKSVCGSARQLKNATAPSSRLKWLRPRRKDGKIAFSKNAGKKEDFEEVSDCELNDIGISYTDASEGMSIWRPRRKHHVRRDKCILNLCFFRFDTHIIIS
jgi:hypothetical protein